MLSRKQQCASVVPSQRRPYGIHDRTLAESVNRCPFTERNSFSQLSSLSTINAYQICDGSGAYLMQGLIDSMISSDPNLHTESESHAVSGALDGFLAARNDYNSSWYSPLMIDKPVGTVGNTTKENQPPVSVDAANVGDFPKGATEDHTHSLHCHSSYNHSGQTGVAAGEGGEIPQISRIQNQRHTAEKSKKRKCKKNTIPKTSKKRAKSVASETDFTLTPQVIEEAALSAGMTYFNKDGIEIKYCQGNPTNLLKDEESIVWYCAHNKDVLLWWRSPKKDTCELDSINHQRKDYPWLDPNIPQCHSITKRFSGEPKIPIIDEEFDGVSPMFVAVAVKEKARKDPRHFLFQAILNDEQKKKPWNFTLERFKFVTNALPSGGFKYGFEVIPPHLRESASKKSEGYVVSRYLRNPDIPQVILDDIEATEGESNERRVKEYHQSGNSAGKDDGFQKKRARMSNESSKSRAFSPPTTSMKREVLKTPEHSHSRAICLETTLSVSPLSISADLHTAIDVSEWMPDSEKDHCDEFEFERIQSDQIRQAKGSPLCLTTMTFYQALETVVDYFHQLAKECWIKVLHFMKHSHSYIHVYHVLKHPDLYAEVVGPLNLHRFVTVTQVMEALIHLCHHFTDSSGRSMITEEHIELKRVLTSDVRVISDPNRICLSNQSIIPTENLPRSVQRCPDVLIDLLHYLMESEWGCLFTQLSTTQVYRRVMMPEDHPLKRDLRQIAPAFQALCPKCELCWESGIEDIMGGLSENRRSKESHPRTG